MKNKQGAGYPTRGHKIPCGTEERNFPCHETGDELTTTLFSGKDKSGKNESPVTSAICPMEEYLKQQAEGFKRIR